MVRVILGILVGLVTSVVFIFLTGYLTIHSRMIEQGLSLHFDLTPNTVIDASPAMLQQIALVFVAGIFVAAFIVALVSRRPGLFAKATAIASGITLWAAFSWGQTFFRESFYGAIHEIQDSGRFEQFQDAFFILREGSQSAIPPLVSMVIILMLVASIARQHSIRA